MTTAIASQEPNYAQIISQVITAGDLSGLTPEQRTGYYLEVCKSTGLNPLTKPFAYLELKNKDGSKKVVLYALKDCTEQLRKRDNVSVEILDRLLMDDVYIVRAKASLPNGRQDESLGALSLKGLNAEDRANAIMKAETKAKRRVTLSICGLGFLDETEALDLPGAKMIEGEVK